MLRGPGGGTCPLRELILVFTRGLPGAPQVSRGARVGILGYQGAPRIPTYHRGEGTLMLSRSLHRASHFFTFHYRLLGKVPKGFQGAPQVSRGLHRSSGVPRSTEDSQGLPGGVTPVVSRDSCRAPQVSRGLHRFSGVPRGTRDSHGLTFNTLEFLGIPFPPVFTRDN